MKLCYRGVVHSYYSSSIESVETQRTATFLSKTYKLRQPIYQPGQKTLNLVYRGVAYSTGNGLGDRPSPQASCPSEFVTQLSAQLGLSN